MLHNIPGPGPAIPKESRLGYFFFLKNLDALFVIPFIFRFFNEKTLSTLWLWSSFPQLVRWIARSLSQKNDDVAININIKKDSGQAVLLLPYCNSGAGTAPDRVFHDFMDPRVRIFCSSESSIDVFWVSIIGKCLVRPQDMPKHRKKILNYRENGEKKVSLIASIETVLYVS